MTKSGAPPSGGSSLPPYPEMGRTTRPGTNAPFSLRLPDELRAKVRERAASRNLTVGEYIRDLVEADLSGTAPRRRRKKHDDLRRDLAKIHAAIITCGNQIKRVDRLCTSDRCRRLDDDQDQILLLKDAASSLILLARSIRVR
jgi:hypothetical protein